MRSGWRRAWSFLGHGEEASATVLQLAEFQLSAELQSSAQYDAKASALLAFDGVAIGAVLAGQRLIGPLWWIPLVTLVVSAVLAILAVENRRYDLGPDPLDFYERAAQEELSDAEVNAALVLELDRALQTNDRRLRWKVRLFFSALVMVVSSAVVTAIVSVVR
jgi:hypothetical protein